MSIKLATAKDIEELRKNINEKVDSQTVSGGFAGGKSASAGRDGGAIGQGAYAYRGGAVGYNAATGNGFAGGYNARTQANGLSIDAVQLGEGINTEEKTLKVYDYKLMNKDGSIPDERITNKADRQTVSGGFVAGKSADVLKVEGTPLEYFYIGQYSVSEKITYVSGKPETLFDNDNTGSPVNSAAQIFNVFDLGKPTNISMITLYVSDGGADGANMVCIGNELPGGSARYDVLRTNGKSQNSVPVIENRLDTDGYIKVGYTDGRYIGTYRYITVYNWSSHCTASEIYVETDVKETPINAIQLGEGTNNSPYTMQVYGYTLMDRGGIIPEERMLYGSIEHAGIIKLYSKNGVNRSGIMIYDDGSAVVNTVSEYGTARTGDGKVTTVAASEADIDEGVNRYKPIVPANLEYAVGATRIIKELEERIAALEEGN